jgi:hypothetical protein
MALARHTQHQLVRSAPAAYNKQHVRLFRAAMLRVVPFGARGL